MTLRVRMADGEINFSADIIFQTLSRDAARVFALNLQPPETKVVHCLFRMFHSIEQYHIDQGSAEGLAIHKGETPTGGIAKTLEYVICCRLV
jgi:hypothetical protein